MSSWKQARRRAPRWRNPPASMRSSARRALRPHPARARRPACRAAGSARRCGRPAWSRSSRWSTHDRRGDRGGFCAAARADQASRSDEIERRCRAPAKSRSRWSETRVDLGLLATEFLILGIDPYPRKPDAAFEAPAAADAAGAPVRGACGMKKKGHSQGITARTLGALCVRPPNRYGPPRTQASTICPSQDGLPGRTWPKRSELRSMPWGATSGLRSWFPAPSFRSPATRHRIHPVRRRGRGRVRWSTQRPRLKAASRLVHTDVVVKMDAKPSQALRQGRWKSSMWLAIDAVKKGEADVAVSAGNTGALMAMAKFNLRTMAGIERPAIAGAVADAQGRLGRARCRRLDRRRRRSPGRSRRDGQRDGARAVRPRAADRRPAQYRRRGGEGPGGGARGRAHPARSATCRSSTMWASSRATTSARARSTWW